MPDSAAFEQLSPGVQRWLYRQGWNGLRPVQENSIPIILERSSDLLITAPTAGGKTEAAFLPLVSFIESEPASTSYTVLCISPLKALINDQFERLESLCEMASTRITPWHGDVSPSRKKQSWKAPTGILLITPESLEAMFVTRPAELGQKLAALAYVVIDEFHAFIGRERGQQLLSLLARLENVLERRLPRIALSATIGDPEMALASLRPADDFPSIHLHTAGDALDLSLVLKTIISDEDDSAPFAQRAGQELYPCLRGDSHLVFANSRRMVEAVSVSLSDASEKDVVPNEFFPHHGSLSRDARYAVENRLKEGKLPTTAIATSTLELGIDIGNVKSVAQVGAPASVSSLRQRLGRSGRRGEPAILRIFVEGSGHTTNATPIDRVELALIQSIAVVDLLLAHFLEPPQTHRLHLSTLVQQVLSMIAYRGDVTAAGAFDTLCRRGPWSHLSTEHFSRVLRAMGAAELIQQLPRGELIVGIKGERLISHYSFYTAFVTPEEYRLVAEGKLIGTLPVTTPYTSGQLLIFGGRRWLVQAVEERTKTIKLKPAKGGDIPKFDGEAYPIHSVVREKMRSVLEASDQPGYCDAESLAALERAREYYSEVGLRISSFVVSGPSTYWFVWHSDAVIATFVQILKNEGYEAGAVGNSIVIDSAGEPSDIVSCLKTAFDSVTSAKMRSCVTARSLGKFDEHLGDELLKEAYVTDLLDLDSARSYLVSGHVRY